MREDRDRILDMLAAIHNAERYAAEGRERFARDELVQVYFTHQILLLGEAASRISAGVRERFTQVPWGQMIGMRNALVHGYFAIELDMVWDAVQRDLPLVGEQLQRILETLG